MFLYKPIGKTCCEVLDKDDNSKNAICGRLDPMARGMMLYISGDETKQTKQHLTHTKTYKFKFVMGYSTDTSDVMGILTNNYPDTIDINHIIEYVDELQLNTPFRQKYHKFSSFRPLEICPITNKRMPLWFWSANKLPTATYEKDVMIHHKEIINIEKIHSNDIKRKLLHSLSLVTDQSHFRLPEIIKQWNQDVTNKNMVETTMILTVSAGFYIRQFVQDMSDKFNVKMMVTDINRLSIG